MPRLHDYSRVALPRSEEKVTACQTHANYLPSFARFLVTPDLCDALKELMTSREVENAWSYTFDATATGAFMDAWMVARRVEYAPFLNEASGSLMALLIAAGRGP